MTRGARRGSDVCTLDAGGRIVAGGAVAFACYLIAAPLLMLLLTAFRGPEQVLPFEPGATWSLEHFAAVYRDPVLYTSILPQTLAFATGAVSLASVLAFALAWVIERTDVPWPNAWYAFVLFPLLVPTVMLGIAWIWLFGPNAGWVNVGLRALWGWTGSGPIELFTLPGLIVCQALATTPFMFLMFCATLRSMNPVLEEASSLSGASPWRTFARVTLPVLLPGVLAPVLLSLLITLEQFELPLVIGLPARVNVFSTRIFYELTPASGLPNYGAAAAVALPFLALGLALLAAYNALVRRGERHVTVIGKAYRPTRFALGRWRGWVIAALVAYVVIADLLPAVILAWISVAGYAVPSVDALGALSLEGWRVLFASEYFWRAVVNTLVVAGASALLATLTGAILAWLLTRCVFPGRFLVDAVSFMSIAIPSVIAALGLLVFYLSVPVGIYGTVPMLVLAYTYRLSVTTRVNRAGVMQLHRELEEASAVSGARWLTTMRRIVWPLMAPSMVASFALVFIIGCREFTLPLFLGSNENIVLPVVLWRFFEAGLPAPTAALGTLLIVVVTPILFLLRRAADRPGRLK